MSSDGELRPAAAALAAAGLVDAFGHVSFRSGSGFSITPPVPLGEWSRGSAPAIEVDLGAGQLPSGAPGEAWLHWCIYDARPDVAWVCRAQPQRAQAFGVSGRALRPLDGHGCFLGREVAIHADPTLVRSEESGRCVAASLGGSSALLLRGNGALTVGASAAEAVVRMWALERSARLHLRAVALGQPQALDDTEIERWQAAGGALMVRVYEYLVNRVNTL